MVQQAMDGDPDALGAFYDHYFDHVFGLIHKLVGRRQVAEDLTQDVFLKIQRALPRFDASRNPTPWVYTITVNACRDLWRSSAWRAGQRSMPLDGPEIVALASTDAGPEQAMMRADELRLLRRALESLPDAQRVTVVLHDSEGLDHREIAQITGASYSTVRKRYSRAVAFLAAQLREEANG